VVLCERSAPEEGVDVPLRGTPSHLILAGVPWVISRFPYILVGYNRESLSELVCLVLYSKLSSCPWAHMSGRAGPTNRSAGLLVGRTRLSGTTETVVGGDPWVPMSLSRGNNCGAPLGAMANCRGRGKASRLSRVGRWPRRALRRGLTG
jgi:hypothetical protein